MIAYCTTQSPVMVERLQVTNIVVPQTYQVRQIVREPAIIQPVLQQVYSPVRQYAAPQFSPSPVMSRKTVSVGKYDEQSQLKNDLQSQLNTLFLKLEQMDHTLNDLSLDIHRIGGSQQSKGKRSLIRSGVGDEESTKLIDDTSKRLQQAFQTPPNNRIAAEDRDTLFRESQINEVLSRVQLIKGVRFGDYYYFGDLNESNLRDGYGALYDLQGRIIYCGYWLRDRFHNRGKLYFYDTVRRRITLDSFADQSSVHDNRASYTGQFNQGEMKGLGQMMFQQVSGPERFVLYGRFLNGMFNGKGTVLAYARDMEEESSGIQGEWRDGKLVKAAKDYQPRENIRK